MLALPKNTLKMQERNGTELIIERYSKKVCGAKMVPNSTKPTCAEI